MDNQNMNEEVRDLVEMEDEDGNIVTLEVMRYFFYNGEEYVVLNELQDEEEETDEEEVQVNCYIMKVVEGQDGDEEVEDFLPIEDDDLFNKLVEVANAEYAEDQEFDD